MLCWQCTAGMLMSSPNDARWTPLKQLSIPAIRKGTCKVHNRLQHHTPRIKSSAPQASRSSWNATDQLYELF